MIKATDLRIGNWYVNQWSEYLQVDPDLFGADNLESYPIPIPINPEILERCGFEMHKTSQLWRKGNFYLHHYLISDNEYCFKYSDFKSSSIQYLHQLQNLYYSLTNEELEFKP